LSSLIVTIPCHNDSKFLESAVLALKKELEGLEKDFLIIIAEDGSTDDSAEISKHLADQDSKIVHFHADSKLGRGSALMNAWEKVDGQIYAYIDCDLATDMRFFPDLINYIEEGYDLATGSRYLEGSMCRRPFLRKLTSKGYNAIIRLLFSDGVHDHQCGFKAYSKRMVDHILRECKDNDWFWDTETIVLAHRDGFSIKEFPVEWEEKKGRRTPLKRLMKDIWIHGVGTLNLLFNRNQRNSKSQ
jgi:hypothetical protein